MTRKEVYTLIDSERDYQNRVWNDLDNRNNVADFLAYMWRYFNVALTANNPDNPTASLDAIRKITALGVACMERFGAPARHCAMDVL